MSGPYVCSLDEATQDKALRELGEDPKNRQGAIDTFRQWILQQKHIRCPTGQEICLIKNHRLADNLRFLDSSGPLTIASCATQQDYTGKVVCAAIYGCTHLNNLANKNDVFLLAFLRTRKFSQLEARGLLEKFLARRQKVSKWFLELDPCDPAIERALDDGFLCVLPGYDADGRKIIFVRTGKMDIKRKNDFWRASVMLLDYIHLCHEQSQVHGTATVADFSNTSLAQHTQITIEEKIDFLQTWQKRYPARIKGMHFYNAGAFLEFVMMIIKGGMSDKLQQRLVMHGNSLESLYKHIPMEMLPEEYLPDDYTGPKAGTMKHLIDNMKKDMARPEMRQRLQYLSSKQHGIDLKEKDHDIPQQSFRKLNVD